MSGVGETDASLSPIAGNASPPRLGLDLYSLRSQGWTAFQHLDFCHDHGVEVAQFSGVDLIGGIEPAHLREVKAHADGLGIDLEVGMGSICETAASFRGPRSAADQLSKMIGVAHALGSPIVRCFLGNVEDRQGPPGAGPMTPRSPLPIDDHIAATIATCRRVRAAALDLGVKVAIENHVGDLQSTELRRLIEVAGPDYVGALLDTGNAMWCMETPGSALATLAPYVVASQFRDGVVTEHADGVAFQWCAFGHGNVAIAEVISKYIEWCPSAAVTLEIINKPDAQVLAYRRPGFWDLYRAIPAWSFAEFVEVARTGEPYSRRLQHYLAERAAQLPDPPRRELADVEEALDFARMVVGIGARRST